MWLVSLYKKQIRTHTHTQKKTMWRYKEKVTIYQPKKEASEETDSANSSIVDFYPLEFVRK